MKTKKELDALIEFSKNFPCYGKRVLIVRDSGEEITENGIIMPEAKMAKLDDGTHAMEVTKQTTGIVVAKGGKCEGEYKIGDRVKFNMWANDEFTHKGMTYLTMTDDDIFMGLPYDFIDLSMESKKHKRADVPTPTKEKMKILDKEGKV